MVTLGHTIGESQLLMWLIARSFRHAWVTMARSVGPRESWGWAAVRQIGG